MSEASCVAAFLDRWTGRVAHDLSGSDSETLSLSALLALAGPEDAERWRDLSFGYAEARGAPWLRAAIADRHAKLDPDDILCCAGAQEAVSCVLSALLGPDDHAIVLLPIYPPSELAVTRLCATTGVTLDPDTWRLDVDRVAAAIRPDTKLVLANFPNSPTGARLDPDTLDRLVNLCSRHGLWLVNDEIYRHTDASAWWGTLPRMADAYERGVSIDGLSKGFGLPGLRVGWLACRSPDLLSAALRVKSGLSSCLSSASEILAHIALRNEATIVSRTREIGARNRLLLDALIDRVPDVFTSVGGDNLAFAFPQCRGRETMSLVARMAEEAGVLVLPSAVWASTLAPAPTRYVRIGLGHARNALGLEAVERLLTGYRVA